MRLLLMFAVVCRAGAAAEFGMLYEFFSLFPFANFRSFLLGFIVHG